MSALISFGIYLASSGIIILPIDGIVSDVVIDWGDGNTSSPISYINPLHNYDTPGSYTIKIISGSFTAINTLGSNLLYKSSLIYFFYNTQIAGLTDFNYAFANILTNFILYFAPNVTNNVTNMTSMFYNAITFNQSLFNLDTSNVTNMSGMFINTSSFNNGNAAGFSNFPLNLNTSNVTDMSNMFKNSIVFNQDISNFNTGNVTNMTNMFKNAAAFNQSLSSFNISNLSIASDMLTFSGLSSTNYDNLLTSWASQSIIQSGVIFDAGTIQYTSISAQSAHNKLTNAPYEWSISDGGANIPPTN